MKDEVYIYAPGGVKCEYNCVFKLNKSLYGLKQSPKCRNKDINCFLINLGFIRSENNYCLYFKVFNSGRVYLLIYMYDTILAGKGLLLIENIKQSLMSKFKMIDKGEL